MCNVVPCLLCWVVSLRLRPFSLVFNFSPLDSNSLSKYEEYIAKSCEGTVAVTSVSEVRVERPKRLPSEPPRDPPLFKVEIRVKEEPVCLNKEAVEERNQEIREWEESPEAKKPKVRARRSRIPRPSSLRLRR